MSPLNYLLWLVLTLVAEQYRSTVMTSEDGSLRNAETALGTGGAMTTMQRGLDASLAKMLPDLTDLNADTHRHTD